MYKNPYLPRPDVLIRHHSELRDWLYFLNHNEELRDKKGFLEKLKRQLGIHLARVAAVNPDNRSVPRSVVNALNPTRPKNNNSAPYNKYSFKYSNYRPIPYVKNMVLAYRRARQLETNELKKFFKKFENQTYFNMLGAKMR
tara:strand:+ start:1964 stop:2386 length:423 start_codon:yes stop_codon:yes gene_type:complete